jgi:hypothetical protein
VVNSFVTEIASRFGVVVSERFAAAALPVLGAIGGAAINLMFMNHFQRVAQGHFTIRRLERIYGRRAVQRHYEQLSLAGYRHPDPRSPRSHIEPVPAVTCLSQTPR